MAFAGAGASAPTAKEEEKDKEEEEEEEEEVELKTDWRRWVRRGRCSGLLCRGSRLKGWLWDLTGPALESRAISSQVTVPAQCAPAGG